jgi:uroporphyrin-III C-methyltransferase
MADTPNTQLPDRRKASPFTNTALILAFIALVALAWLWINTRQHFNTVEKSLSLKLETYQELNQKSLILAKQAEERSVEANARTVILEQKLEESRDQQDVLQTLYDQLAENREATALSEVEQLLTIANQQLQLVGNVKTALLALQAADSRLEPLNLPRANQLRETLGLEIKNLRRLPQVDVVGMSAQLETLADLCATIPLISERQPTLNTKAAQQNAIENVHPNTWQKIAYPIWADIKNLVTVERIDKPEPPLLSADHEFYLRENLKLRLLTARVALLQHDEVSYKADLATVTTWINQYYDAKHPNATLAFKLLKRLSDKDIDIELPQLRESFAAVNRYKLSLENSD